MSMAYNLDFTVNTQTKPQNEKYKGKITMADNSIQGHITPLREKVTDNLRLTEMSDHFISLGECK